MNYRFFSIFTPFLQLLSNPIFLYFYTSSKKENVYSVIFSQNMHFPFVCCYVISPASSNEAL